MIGRPHALLATVRPCDVAGGTPRRVAAELVADLERIYARSMDADKELTGVFRATGTTVMDLHGIGRPVPPGRWSRSATSPASRTTTSGLGPVLHRSPPRAKTCATGSPAGTVRSTGSCTSWPADQHVQLRHPAERPITAGETTLFDPCSIPIRRYRYRGNAIPKPLHAPTRNQPDSSPCGEPGAMRVARRVRRAAWGKRTTGNRGTAPHADSPASASARSMSTRPYSRRTAAPSWRGGPWPVARWATLVVPVAGPASYAT